MMETTSVSTLKVEPVACLACGKQVWVGVGIGRCVCPHYGEPPDDHWEGCPQYRSKILHLDFLGGTLEQDDTGAFRPSAKHQYTIHEHQPGER